MKDEFHGVPADVLPVLERLVSDLGKLTLLDQQTVLEMLVTRHVVKRAYPDAAKVKVIFADVVINILDMIKLSAVETTRARKNKS